MAVVIEQFQPESPCLHTNSRICLWIESLGPAENLDSNLIFLQRHAGLGDGVVGEISEKFAKRFSLAKGVALDNFINLPKKAMLIRELNRCNCHVTSSRNSLNSLNHK
jgi:hypothetical protein